MNLIDYVNAGIYQITCLKVNKKYIGESQNILERLGKHTSTLNRQTHDCLSLQNDWNKYGKEQFKIQILFIGKKWEDLEKRKNMQDSIIEQLPLIERYNLPSNEQIYQQVIEIDSVQYNSIAQAAQSQELSETTIRRRLNSTEYPNYSRKEIKKGRRISIEGNIYPSINTVVQLGLANNRSQVYRRVQSQKTQWRKWYFIDEKRQV